MKYFITTVGFYSDKYTCAQHDRCVGYFDTFEEAEKAVLENRGDIYECGFYMYAVIEAIKPGLYNTDFNPSWYRADWIESSAEYPLGRYSVVKTDPPEFAECTCGWVMG